MKNENCFDFYFLVYCFVLFIENYKKIKNKIVEW